MLVAVTPVIEPPPPLSPCHTGTHGGIWYPGTPTWRPFLSQWLRSWVELPAPAVGPLGPVALPPAAVRVPVAVPAAAPAWVPVLLVALTLPPAAPAVADVVPSAPVAVPLPSPVVGPAAAATSWFFAALGPLDGAMATRRTCTAATAMKGR